MNCTEVRDRIEWDPSETSMAVEAHVADCGDCREYFALQRELDRSLSNLFAAPAPSVDLAERVRAAVQREKSHALLESLAEVLPMLGGLAATAICSALLPGNRAAVMCLGILLVAVSYLWQSSWSLYVQEDER